MRIKPILIRLASRRLDLILNRRTGLPQCRVVSRKTLIDLRLLTSRSFCKILDSVCSKYTLLKRLLLLNFSFEVVKFQALDLPVLFEQVNYKFCSFKQTVLLALQIVLLIVSTILSFVSGRDFELLGEWQNLSNRFISQG